MAETFFTSHFSDLFAYCNQRFFFERNMVTINGNYEDYKAAVKNHDKLTIIFFDYTNTPNLFLSLPEIRECLETVDFLGLCIENDNEYQSIRCLVKNRELPPTPSFLIHGKAEGKTYSASMPLAAILEVNKFINFIRKAARVSFSLIIFYQNYFLSASNNIRSLFYLLVFHCIYLLIN